MQLVLSQEVVAPSLKVRSVVVSFHKLAVLSPHNSGWWFEFIRLLHHFFFFDSIYNWFLVLLPILRLRSQAQNLRRQSVFTSLVGTWRIKTSCDIHIWSIGPFFFLLTCFQGVVASSDNTASTIVAFEKSMAAATFVTSTSDLIERSIGRSSCPIDT